MKKHLLNLLLLLLLAADIAYSFRQHLSQPLDGDMAWNIVPSGEVLPVLSHPFGIPVITEGRRYPNPNRFFCQWSIREYFNTVPLALQRVTDPIKSVYLSCALAKTAVQLFLVILLAGAAAGTFRLWRTDFLLAALLVTPLFQTEGYQSYMGIIDRAPSYVFFYALPVAFLALYLVPLFFRTYYGRRPTWPWLIRLLWIPFALVLSLSGPLVPGVALVLSLLLFAAGFRSGMQAGKSGVTRMRRAFAAIPADYWWFLVPISLFSLYSLYLGSFNTNNGEATLGALYSRLPQGILLPLTRKLGFPVLLGILAVNYLLIRRKSADDEGRKILRLFHWAGLFIILYILLLPLGGYRYYRPNVIRYDTLIPVTLCLIFLFAISTLYLLRNLRALRLKWYIPVAAGVLLLYTLNDEPHFDKNAREQAVLRELAASPERIVPLPADCWLLSWTKVVTPRQSDLYGRLLYQWNVTPSLKWYYNQ